MIRTKELKIILPYLKTIIITLSAMLLFILALLLFVKQDVFDYMDRQSQEDEVVEYYLIGLLIEKNKFLALENPESYKINLKLGVLYELYKDYVNAEVEYKKAISKAPYGDLRPIFRLANMYVARNRLNEAQKLVDDITETPNKKTIDRKAQFYYKLADKYYSMGDYKTAIEKYKKSKSYYEKINSNQIKQVNKGLASSYVYLSDMYIEDGKITEAIELLKNVDKIIGAPIIKYRLALILMDTHPTEAYNYFNEVFKKEPTIIGFDIYYNFLTKLALIEELEGNIAQNKLYLRRAEKYKEYYDENILLVEDIQLNILKTHVIINNKKKQYEIHFAFKLKNNSIAPISNLFLDVKFKDGDKLVDEHFSQIITAERALPVGKETEDIIVTSVQKFKKENKNSKQITIEVYVSKSDKSYQLPLGVFEIDKGKEKI